MVNPCLINVLFQTNQHQNEELLRLFILGNRVFMKIYKGRVGIRSDKDLFKNYK